MGRIRTVKPDFFKHEELFEAEQETGLPLRLAYIGLWTQADREGRFLWRPRPLKLDILPYDDCDFSRVLDALATRGFIVRYTDGTREIGAIPSFPRHQVVNNRESPSTLPSPPENIEQSDASPTRAPRVTHASCGEGKGKEGKGTIEPNGSMLSVPAEADPAKPKSTKKRNQYPEAFEAAWKAYPTTPNMSKAEALPQWNKLSAQDQAKVLPSIPPYRAFLAGKRDLDVIHFCRYLSYRRFEGFSAAVVGVTDTIDDWESRLAAARDGYPWATWKWGPLPGLDGSRVPADLIRPGDGQGWREEPRAA